MRPGNASVTSIYEPLRVQLNGRQQLVTALLDVINCVYLNSINRITPITPLVSWDNFYRHEVILIPAWINKHMTSKVWSYIAYPYPNVDGAVLWADK